MTFELAHDEKQRPLQGKKAAVVGLGRSGLAAIELCLARGASVRAADEKSFAELAQVASKLREKGVELALGGLSQASWRGADFVVVSPGVPLSSPALLAAKAAGVPVLGEVELAWRFLEQGQPLALGITGTNGKSTTTALTGALLKLHFARVFVGGNLGRPWCEAALEEQPFDAHVVELSSFQLEGIERARFHGATWLNLTPDHLDRYESHASYGEAKARIFMNQGSRSAQAPSRDDVLVVNADDADVVRLSCRAPSWTYAFTLQAGRPIDARWTGWAMPAPADALGRARFVASARWANGEIATFTVGSRALRGEHNLQNAMAAALLAAHVGVPAAAIQAGLDDFPGLPHRLESARTLDGVEWVNDSKATNVDSVLVALKAFPGNLWVIAGGKGKGAPYAPMVEASRGKVKGVLTIGKDAPAIEAAYRGVAKAFPCGTLKAAVARARALATAGDVVLLSPACASYDQFKNFEERGDTFKHLVGAL